MKKYNTFTIMKWVFLFGSILVLPFGFKEYTLIQWDTFPVSIWLASQTMGLGTLYPPEVVKGTMRSP